MATFVLQAVGTSLGGPIGGAIGAVVGSLIDQALFGPGDQEGPRLTDLNVTTSTYGAPIPLPYGPENRMAGNIIWSTDLIETSEEQGGKGGGPSVTTYSYRVSCAIALSAREVTGAGLKRVFANGKVIYDADAIFDYSPNTELPAIDPVEGQIVTRYYTDETVSPEETRDRGTHSVFDELHFYPGNGSQQPDPLIESFEGAGNVPGYRHTAYVVIKDLQLADFGNRIPNFEFELEADESITVAEVAQDIFSRGDISPVSVIGLTENLRGYVISRQSPVYSAMIPLEVSFDFEVSEQNGQLRCVRRARGPKGSIPITDMGANQDQLRDPNPVQFKNVTEVQLPDEVSITFKDPDLDYQPNTQKAYRVNGNAINLLSQEVPVVLTADRGRQIAERLMWGAHAERKGASFNLSDKWLRAKPGDIMGVPVAGETLMFKCVRITRGYNGVIESDWSHEDPEVYTSAAVGVAGAIPRQSIQIPGDTLWVPMDAPLLRDTDAASGFYWAATGESDGWRGAEIKRSSDGGITYSKMSDIALRTPIGTVSGTLGSGPTVVFDNLNTLTVTLTHSSSTLESLSELLVLNGNNAAWIGPPNGGEGEIIQFKTATLVAAQTYELTGLLRGRLGTEHMVDAHNAGEVFVLLKQGTLGSSDFGTSDWNKQRDYKPVTFLNDELQTDAQQFTNTGVRSKPLSPVHVNGSRNGSNDLTIEWVRRSRLRQPGLGNGSLPLGEEFERYEIDIYDGATVVRTIEVSDATTTTYTAAQQTTDGLTPGNLVTMDIYQLSATIGRGYAARAII